MSIYKRVLETNGSDFQRMRIAEELCELAQAVLKGTDIDNIEEEIADVQIVFKYLPLVFDISKDRIQEWKDIKIKRLKKDYPIG